MSLKHKAVGCSSPLCEASLYCLALVMKNWVDHPLRIDTWSYEARNNLVSHIYRTTHDKRGKKL